MATLTVGQVLALGRKHGFTDAELPDLYAVTTTESGNRTDARQAGGLGRGLVQIDLGQHPKVTEAQAMDPDFAMAYARRLYLERRWAPWYGPRDRPKVAEEARQEARKALARGDKGDLSFLEGLNPLKSIPDAAGNLLGVGGDAAGAVGGAVGGAVTAAINAAIRTLFPASLVRRVLLVFGGAGMLMVGATALGLDIGKTAVIGKATARVPGGAGAVKAAAGTAKVAKAVVK